MPKAALNGLKTIQRFIVEEDLAQQAIAQGIPEGITRIFASQNSAFDIDGVDDNRVDADVAILDTGIDVDHPTSTS